ncbi:response regulator transcription factor [Mesorhizobium sp. CA18]|uniref:LuxR C-terminal-related transcriptional regulator n=1 Tax=unclassified Mesorhizobium TaxID=325217 RepID=UPI001CCAE92C|nr:MULTISPECIES: response regulator transcription factor [unclassified Mesorhizobium]MBZ9733452.1 response regulator transcription factor [Mesorhizobium sp. CA9]MBZ9824117.1 response regulator transcription factor [Mesorhizobium sp. CA18]MBZ9831397.1 response regulator transcription factor [Mesorhizobium sp. CA2]MBZ9837561.1 response regulator transcription factor [Mesorhizobium sp. CA3]MBZ9877155.1 response regulator transcription factor [Mesorhizobium sp. Ca11]
MYRVVIADDHGLYRRGLSLALKAELPELEIFEAGCFDAAASVLAERDIHLAILDLNMPGLFNQQVLGDVLSAYPDTRFAIVSGNDSRAEILKALSIGLHGYIVKSQTDQEVVSAVREILAGRIYVPALLSRPSGGPGSHAPQSARAWTHRRMGAASLSKLTSRQRDVLKLMAEGFSNKEIARDLDISEATTKIHAAAVMRELGVRNRTEAAVALQNWRSKYID